MPRPQEHMGSVGRRYQQRRKVSARVGGRIPKSRKDKILRGILRLANRGAITVRAKDKQGRIMEETIRK